MSVLRADEIPCRDPGPCESWLAKLCVMYRKYKVVVWITVAALFIGGVTSGLLFTTAAESKVKTCFGPRKYTLKGTLGYKNKFIKIDSL